MPKPIEETMIVPSEYSEFATVFPAIYRKISERLNNQSSVEKIAAFLSTEKKVVFSYKPDFVTPAMYLIYGQTALLPAACGICMFSKGDRGLILPFTNHSPAGVSISMQLVDGDLELGLSSGEGAFEISLLFI